MNNGHGVVIDCLHYNDWGKAYRHYLIVINRNKYLAPSEELTSPINTCCNI